MKIHWHFISSSIGFRKFIYPLYSTSKKGECKIFIFSPETIEDHGSYPDFNFIKTPSFSLSLKSFLNIFKLIKVFSTFIKCNKPSVLFCHYSRAAFLPLFLGYFFNISSRVYFNHGIPYLGYSGVLSFFLKLVEEINCLFSTRIITVSNGMVDAFSCIYFSRSREILVIKSGSSAGIFINNISLSQLISDRFSIRSIYKLKRPDIVFLYVGRAVRRKGLYDSFSWVSDFSKGYCGSIHLWLAGISEADVPSDLLDMAHKSNINLRVFGVINYLDDLYKCSNFTLLPSIHEGFGYSLLEGASNGSIPIAYDIPGPNQFISNNYTGLLISKSGGIIDFSERINNLLEREKGLLSMQKHAFLRSHDFSSLDYSKFFLKIF